jgi:hypothetical protein
LPPAITLFESASPEAWRECCRCPATRRGNDAVFAVPDDVVGEDEAVDNAIDLRNAAGNTLDDRVVIEDDVRPAGQSSAAKHRHRPSAARRAPR